MAENLVTIEGTVATLDALRHTPAGIPIVKAGIAHDSEQEEAGGKRRVMFEVACVAVELEARLLAAAPLGARIRASGFLAAKGATNRQLVLHVRRIEFLDTQQENEHGIR